MTRSRRMLSRRSFIGPIDFIRALTEIDKNLAEGVARRKLFADHVVGSRPMKRRNNIIQCLICIEP